MSYLKFIPFIFANIKWRVRQHKVNALIWNRRQYLTAIAMKYFDMAIFIVGLHISARCASSGRSSRTGPGRGAFARSMAYLNLVKVKEGNRERLQSFEGVVIAKRN